MDLWLTQKENRNGVYAGSYLDEPFYAAPTLSFVLVQRDAPNVFTALDHGCERDAGEEIGKFILFRVRLRAP